MNVGRAVRLVTCAVQVACGARSELNESAPVPSFDGGSSTSLCSTPDRAYSVCNGSNGCFPPDAQTLDSACALGCTSQPNTPSEVGLCLAGPGIEGGYMAPDGHVYVANAPLAPNGFFPYPYEVGVLFAANGGAERVHYADWAPWTGVDLPTPATCPTFANFRICGGNCAPCESTETCSGRSPNHPWGLCLPTATPCGSQDAALACGGGDTCFVFVSTSDGQPLADRHGICVSVSFCSAVAAAYPGGASCH